MDTQSGIHCEGCEELPGSVWELVQVLEELSGGQIFRRTTAEEGEVRGFRFRLVLIRLY